MRKYFVILTGTLAAGAAPEPYTIAMTDNRFDPAAIELRAGKTYELRLVNRGRTGHEFTAPAFLKAAAIPDKTKLTNGGTDIVILPGKTVSVVLTAPPPGDYELTCADHDWDGMAGHIAVK
jgi:uncharacterized cupredoxin-like copper-binding protein